MARPHPRSGPRGYGTVAAPAVADGRRLVLPRGGQLVTLDLSPDPRPADDLLALAELLAARRVDPTGAVVPMEKDALLGAWKNLRAKYPGQFAGIPK